jgi:FdhD protein
MTQFVSGSVDHWDQTWADPGIQALITEEPLSIRIQGRPYAVVMRTPGEEVAHAAGFCLAEGIVDQLSDIRTLGCCDDGDANVVTVTLTENRTHRVSDLLERRTYISQTSCGICGKELAQDFMQRVTRLPAAAPIPMAEAAACLASLSTHQVLRRQTLSAHAAAIFSPELACLAVAEDVGRHNALDKAVGNLFLAGALSQAAFVVLSSRISYELVQKAARARIPIIIAASRPTALAVELARRLNMTLAAHSKAGGIDVFSVPERLGLG